MKGCLRSWVCCRRLQPVILFLVGTVLTDTKRRGEWE